MGVGARWVLEPDGYWSPMGAPRSPQRTWAENDMFRMHLLSD
jgi:hypothetical protein